MFCVQIYDGVQWVTHKVFPCPRQAEDLSAQMYLDGLITRAVPMSWVVRDTIDTVAEHYID